MDRLGLCLWQGLLSVLKTVYNVLTWAFLMVVIPVFVVPVVTPCLLWRVGVGAVSRLIHGKKFLFEPLTFFDTVFAIDKFYERAYGGNVTFFVVKGNLGLQELRENFCKNVLYKTKPSSAQQDQENKDWQYHKLHRIPYRFGGSFFWKNATIDISRHIREITLGKNVSDKELNEYLSSVMTQPLPKHGGLWELLLLRNYEGDKSVVILRIHHVIADGYSCNRIVDEMIGKRSRYIVKEKELTFKETVKLILKTPGWLVVFGLEELFWGSNWTNVRKKSKEAVLGVTSVDLGTLKMIRQEAKCHFATLGMSILGGALRRLYLETHKEAQLPKYLKMMHLLPKPEHPLDTMCNHWNAGSFKIPMRAKSALKRLEEAEGFFLGITKNHFDRLVGLQSVIAHYMPAIIYDIVLGRNYGTSVAFTSLPAYEHSAELWGYPILNLHKICGLQYQQTALGVALYSHNGQVSFTVCGNTDVIQDAEAADRLVKKYVHEEIQELKAELLGMKCETV